MKSLLSFLNHPRNGSVVKYKTFEDNTIRGISYYYKINSEPLCNDRGFTANFSMVSEETGVETNYNSKGFFFYSEIEFIN